VVLGNDADGYVIADAIRIAPPIVLPAIVDNGDPGYSQVGSWTSATGFGGYLGDLSFAAAGDGSSTATWQAGLVPGSYDVQVTWAPNPNRASNATYRIYDGATLLRTVSVNQRVASSGTSVGGVSFQSLGIVQISTGPLRVVLGNDADGYVIADAVRIAPPTGTSAVAGASRTFGATSLDFGQQALSLSGVSGSTTDTSPGALADPLSLFSPPPRRKPRSTAPR
jgi:hypothetical protein